MGSVWGQYNCGILCEVPGLSTGNTENSPVEKERWEKVQLLVFFSKLGRAEHDHFNRDL